MLNIPTTIIMPDNAPATKRAATAEYGARIIDYVPNEDAREEVALKLQEKHGYTLVPPFNHPEIVAGQGTAALELFQEVGHLDTILAPCGGGGLLSGTAIAAKAHSPDCTVIGIEPELGDDATRSLHSKKLVTIDVPQTIADGTRTTSLGSVTFPLVLEYVDDMRTVSELAICQAIAFLIQRMKLVVEPSGGLGLAALLSGVVRAEGRVGIILSGGNVDIATMAEVFRIAAETD